MLEDMILFYLNIFIPLLNLENGFLYYAIRFSSVGYYLYKNKYFGFKEEDIYGFY